MRIVAAIDASPAARQVLERAIAQARATGAELHVVHVFQPPSAVYAMEGVYLIEDDALAESERNAVWHQVTPMLDGSGVDWTRVDLEGYPAHLIVEHAKEHEADLIVIGSRGRSGFTSFLLGSTSRTVIHDSPVDILVVRTGASE